MVYFFLLVSIPFCGGISHTPPTLPYYTPLPYTLYSPGSSSTILVSLMFCFHNFGVHFNMDTNKASNLFRYLNFKDQLFEQKQGTQGSQTIHQFYALFGNNFLNSYPTPHRLWLRFIDDIFMIWKYGEQQLRRFLNSLNHHHPTIMLTYTMNENEIAFFDTIVYRSPNHRLYIMIYHKPTDQKYYLHYHSAHSRNQKESIAYRLLMRCRRICTEDTYFEEEAK